MYNLRGGNVSINCHIWTRLSIPGQPQEIHNIQQTCALLFQDNYNALHIAAMHSREDVVKLLVSKKGSDVYATGGAREQTAVHMVASRQTGTATSILRLLLNTAGKEVRLRPDGVSTNRGIH